ncbi:hypothetical protein N646_3473 [Vibrio alginolyticus NBRC 15630 = ATCC 17749]|uniref:Uncharacterized protein n=1 Tax=Vibrio alginolyticus (strain ATCC 17749 / DSM 2171 / NBRC 15630 / NCIMB 1903 / NCTC 12160 / XII-53) TaxID=1219076 RepID=A0A2I3CMC7_VIBAX|nr:hypothetical protein N646_3473 [Vibrio alginolyticus NBRC 15630 = ATCC 17749]
MRRILAKSETFSISLSKGIGRLPHSSHWIEPLPRFALSDTHYSFVLFDRLLEKRLFISIVNLGQLFFYCFRTRFGLSELPNQKRRLLIQFDFVFSSGGNRDRLNDIHSLKVL